MQGRPMAAAQNRWLKQMGISMRSIQKCLTDIAAMTLPNACMSAQLPCIQRSCLKLIQVFHSAPPKADQLHHGAQSGYTHFVRDFTSLLTFLTPQLQRLGSRLSIVGPSIAASSIGTAEEEVFWELWKCLFLGCYAFDLAQDSCSDLSVIGEQSFYPSLYAAFHDLLHCLLFVSRTPAWMAMRRQHGLHERNREMVIILAQPLNCLLEITCNTSMPILFSHLSYFPPAVLPLLCCIVSQQLPDLTPTISHAGKKAGATATSYNQDHSDMCVPSFLHQFLDIQTKVIANFACIDENTGRSGKLCFITDQAVIDYLTRVLILPQTAAYLQPGLVLRTLNCLHLLLDLTDADKSIKDTLPFASLNASTAQQDVLGLNKHLLSGISMQALGRDVRLLHALSAHRDADEALTTASYAVQVIIFRNWMLAYSQNPIPSEIQCVMSKSVVGLVKMCTAQGLRMMHKLQLKVKHENACSLEQQIGERQRAQQHAELDDARPASVQQQRSEVSARAIRKSIRSIMFLTTNFVIEKPHPTPSSTSCESKYITPCMIRVGGDPQLRLLQ